MKKILAVITVCAMVLSLSPSDVLSEGAQVQSAGRKVSAKPKPKYNEPAPAEHALTLSDCYRMSLVQSELIAINADLIKITEAHFLQALSIMLPHVSFQSNDFQQGGNTVGGDASSPTTSLKSSTYTIQSGIVVCFGISNYT